VLEARNRFAEVRDVPASNVDIVEYEQVDWPDSCLGVEPRGEPCTEETTPGWRAVVELNGEEHELRAGEAGVIVRWEGQPPLPTEVDLTPEPEVNVVLTPIEGVSAEQEFVPYQAEPLEQFEAEPQHIRVMLTGYPVENDSFAAQLRVYELAAMEAVRGNIEQVLLEYQQILAAVPDVERESLIFLPLIETDQELYARPQVVEFQNGQGYRFVAYYGEVDDEDRVPAGGLFYAYQGVTEDDNHAVVAFLPVSLTDGEELDLAAIESADPSDFTPDLETLDEMIASISLEPR
jgi:hypothetical protein